MRGVAITGFGIVTALGRGEQAHVDALRSGRSGLGPMTLFETPGVDPRPGGVVEASALEPQARWSRCQRLSLPAARDALGASRPAGEGLIAVGTTTGGIPETEQHYFKHRGQEGAEDAALLRNHGLGTIADRLGAELQLWGERQTFSTACSSSANAIGYAAARVAAGLPWALAGGVDALCKTTWCGFYALKLLSAEACRPFDAGRTGLSLGEAAAWLLLEPEEAARARGATVYGRITGWGCSADAHHMTAPHPEGKGAIAAMQLALQDAGLAADQVDYVNAHGTATPANDKAESHALRTLFGERVPPVSSTKGFTGHTLGAAGAVEAIFCLLAIRHGFLPPNVGCREQDPQASVPLVHPQARQAGVRRALSNSFGFGGNNAALVVEGP